MKVLVLVLICLFVIGQATWIQKNKKKDDLPKLPMYIGLGYNILKGNPLHSGSIDPGFTHKLFDFSYNQKQVT